MRFPSTSCSQRKRKSPEHCLKLERWQGPPHVHKVKQHEIVRCPFLRSVCLSSHESRVVEDLFSCDLKTSSPKPHRALSLIYARQNVQIRTCSAPRSHSCNSHDVDSEELRPWVTVTDCVECRHDELSEMQRCSHVDSQQLVTLQPRRSFLKKKIQTSIRMWAR